MNISVSHAVTRDDVEVELEVTGDFYNGELEGFTTTPDIKLDESETAAIEEKLFEAKHDDWDEDSWKAERERE